MLAVDIKLVGDRELIAALAALPAAVQKKAVRKALRDSAKFLHKKIKTAAPRDSGRMARRMKVRAVKRSRSRLGTKIEMPARDKLGIDAGAKGYYPMSIEAGWVPHHSKSGQKVPASNFIRNTTDQNKKKVMDYFEKKLGPAIDREIAKMRARGRS